ncbi:class I SAM-dependent methyltransferase [archaeon]|jgi:ubiquinone/menaquinone biosynthesis C-methylase UbiE|nr:class I SAM-dependent methyltransferase [archaeon]MBT4397800.1 class I SAM-dependent methyltransferase [archaeon]MBT4441134.1 class I SAM-dependent methyltransferase [archaeon]
MYDEIAKGYDRLHKEEQLDKLKIIAQYFKPKALMLDLGCGTGIAMDYFDVDSVGIDPSLELLKLGKGNRVCCYAENLPFKDDSFSSVICLTAVHHMDVDLVIKEVKRVCKGDVCFSVLKKAAKSDEIVKKLVEAFELKIIEEKKDFILFK